MNITLNTNNPVSAASNSPTANANGVNNKKENSIPTEEEVQTAAKSGNFDTLELDNSAVQYLETEKSTASNVVEASSETDVSANTESGLNIVSEEKENYTASDLYTLTETELKDLLLNGDITRSEYNDELSRRSPEE